MSKSPLNDRAYAVEHVKRALRGWAAENLADGAAVFATVSIDDIADAAMADWDGRMADPARRMPNGGPPNKAKELDNAVSHAADRAFLADWLGVAEIAKLAGIEPQTWTAYVNRGQAPQAGRRSPETGRREWRPSVVDAWLASRPGAGTRTDLKGQAMQGTVIAEMSAQASLGSGQGRVAVLADITYDARGRHRRILLLEDRRLVTETGTARANGGWSVDRRTARQLTDAEWESHSLDDPKARTAMLRDMAETAIEASWAGAVASEADMRAIRARFRASIPQA
jgi:hypothetical protein